MNRADLLRWMPSLAKPLAAMHTACERPLAAANALRSRERLALGVGVLALIAAFELTVVLNLHDKRRAIEQALQAGAHDLDATQAAEAAQREARETDLAQREAKAMAALAGLGAAGAPRESLRFLLSRTLQELPVKVVSLRALGAEELELGALPDPSAAAGGTSAEAAAPPGGGVGTPAALLFRHRYELRLSGSIHALLPALETLEKSTRPLRVERVRLAADAAGALQANVVLMTVATQRHWLSL